MLRPLTVRGCILLVVLLGGCTSEQVSYEWTVETTHRWTELPSPQGEEAQFNQLSAQHTGIDFVNSLKEKLYKQNRHLVNGSGVAIGDVDGDGWPDVYLPRLHGPNKLYLNRGSEVEGIAFEESPDAGGAPLPEEFTMGAILEDVTGNGSPDLLVTTLGGPNVLFENTGDGTFRRSRQAGLAVGDGSTTMSLADFNGDETLDLYVANYKRRTVKDIYPPQKRQFEQVVVQKGGEYTVRSDFQKHYEVRRQGNRLMRFERGEQDRVYFNSGNGKFEEQPWTDVFRNANGEPPSRVPQGWGFVARLEDLDGDGIPDLYVCNDFESPDYFYKGTEGEGQFRRVAEEAIRTTSHSTMSIATTDLTRNGTPDFFLADMLGPDYARRKQQVEAASPVLRGVSDVTTRMQEMLNTVQMNRGDGTFAEASRLMGVQASGWTWSSKFLDVDLDGYDDLLLSTGHEYDAIHAGTQMRLQSGGGGRGGGWRESLLQYPDLDLKNVAFRNQGDGSFTRVENGWGIGEQPDVGHGMAGGDFDRDGDMDLVINRLNRSVGVYRNEASAPRVAVQLTGRSPNTGGIGATIRVEPRDGSVPMQEESVIAGGEYLSDSGGTHVFAVGDADRVTISVRWPSGEETKVKGDVGRLYDVRQPGAETDWTAEPMDSTATAGQAAEPASATENLPSERSTPSGNGDRQVRNASTSTDADTATFFEEVSGVLAHEHSDTKYQDFRRQPLLSRRLSQQGPGVAWTDIDGDQDQDLLIGTGRGGKLAYYRNDGAGEFTRVRGNALDQSYERDLTGIVTIPNEGGTTVLVGYSNYERLPDDPSEPSQIFIFKADGKGLRLENKLNFGRGAVGPLALADIDGDGDLDLFAGGRHVPGQYPKSASSAIYLNDEGTFRRSSSHDRRFSGLGMVTGAVFADIEGNGAPDLFVTSEWGPVSYFENRGDGRFVDRTEEVGLSEHVGLWRGIDVGDFNNDGHLDLVAANWGWNSAYGQPPGAPQSPESPGLEDPLRIYYGDFDRNGRTDPIEAFYHSGRDEYLPYKGFREMGQALSYLRRRVKSFERFSEMSLPEIIGQQRFESANLKEASTLSHMVFLGKETDEGPRFEGRAFPWWSQLTTGFAPSVSDLDGDGNQDILLSQNFFATDVKIPRRDAGRGLWLRGDGTGAFTPVKGHNSGLRVYGEQRAAPLADFNRDGRVDVLVAQNGADTKLYRNVGATPGIRVRLEGRGGNLDAIGAVVRLRYADGGMGPASVVSAGSSYWSQHSSTTVLGHGGHSVDAVHVQWPDGRSTERSIDGDPRTITISYPDQ